MILNSTAKISIVTINFNNKVGLEKTMQSVFKQTFPDYEYIIIDGGSTDGSKDLIEANQSKINFWVSEPDKGIYNAMNKGIIKAKGDYLLFLNSGDSLFNTNVLQYVSKKITSEIDIFYGNVNVVDNNGDNKLQIFPENLTFNFFSNSTITHQATFTRRTLFDEVFHYNEKLRVVSDWEFLICAICIFNKSYKNLNITIANYDLNGISSNPDNKKLLRKERQEILEKYFPLFLEDIKKLNEQNKLLNLNRFKILLELENSKIAQKLNSFFLRVILKLFRNKSIKDLD